MVIVKKLILLPLLCLLLSACPGSIVTPTQPSTPIVNAQKAAEMSLYAAGTALKVVPDVLEALYNSGKLSKDDYNETVPVYNQALASFNVAVDTLKIAMAAGKDPSTVTAYTIALTAFLTDKALIDNLVVALGGAK